MSQVKVSDKFHYSERGCEYQGTVLRVSPVGIVTTISTEVFQQSDFIKIGEKLILNKESDGSW